MGGIPGKSKGSGKGLIHAYADKRPGLEVGFAHITASGLGFFRVFCLFFLKPDIEVEKSQGTLERHH